MGFIWIGLSFHIWYLELLQNPDLINSSSGINLVKGFIWKSIVTFQEEQLFDTFDLLVISLINCIYGWKSSL